MKPHLKPDEAMQHALGRNVRRLRRVRGLSRAELAAVTGLSHPGLTVIEGGRGNPRASTLRAIASALGVEIASLLAEASASPETGA